MLFTILNDIIMLAVFYKDTRKYNEGLYVRIQNKQARSGSKISSEIFQDSAQDYFEITLNINLYTKIYSVKVNRRF